ncbi:Beta-lactamase class A [Granulicatella balaenopterae]|uniref:Beta-lactamase class A n=2 Tax=Granulicatella balaenopterae TaxID=137733 RepID=A0A1H9JSX6_9LACT|nr:Beta-lactamase class A [Granulicatella balaenopterae]
MAGLAFSIDPSPVEGASTPTWQQLGTEWVAKKDGQILTDQWLGSYYLKHDGIMAHNEWIWDSNYNSWFYINEDGSYAHDTWKGAYYLKDWGYMAHNEWIWDSNYNSWFYINKDGSYAYDTWKGAYYLKDWGYMAHNEWVYNANTGWHYINQDGQYVQNQWVGAYYLKDWGYMAHNEWVYNANTGWHYINQDGQYVQNQWVGAYYLKDWGYMAHNEWIWDSKYNSWFYINEDGSYAYDTWKGAYYLKDWGYMAHNEWIWDSNYNSWFYLKADGSYAHHEWINGYYLASDGQLSEARANQEILASFNQQFNISGNHAYYYQDLSGKTSEAFGANQDTPIRSASIIKLMILAALYQEVADGQIDLTDSYYLKAEDIVGGTGQLQYQTLGTRYSYYDLAYQMIYSSDNTASNVIIDKLGGLAKTNQLFKQLGFKKSNLQRKFVDTNALYQGLDNYVTAFELADLLSRLYQHQLVTPASDRAMLAILKENPNRDIILKKLPRNITSYHKTGNYSNYGTWNDAGIFVTDKGAFILVSLTSGGQFQQKKTATANFAYDVYRVFQQQ